MASKSWWCFSANMEMRKLEEARENDSLGLRLKVKHLEAKNNALATSLEAKVSAHGFMEMVWN